MAKSAGDNADMDVDVEGQSSTFLNREKLSQDAIKLQNKLDHLRKQLCQARAQKAALKAKYETRDNQLFETPSDELHKLTEERTKTFLNFTSVQAAIRSAELNKVLVQALGLVQGGNMQLEPEEESYVRELLEEQRELSEGLLKDQEIGAEQDIQIIEARFKLSGLLSKYHRLRNEAGQVLLREEEKDKELQNIEKLIKNEDCRLNQIRLILQKLMIGEKNFGQIFDEETNEEFRRIFLRCGMTPDEFRREKLTTPSA